MRVTQDLSSKYSPVLTEKIPYILQIKLETLRFNMNSIFLDLPTLIIYKGVIGQMLSSFLISGFGERGVSLPVG